MIDWQIDGPGFPVLRDPDLLAAMITISSNANSADAVAYGIRWGIGNFIGMIIQGAALAALLGLRWQLEEQLEDDWTNPDNWITYGESYLETKRSERISSLFYFINGICMLALGLHGIFSAIRSRREEQTSIENNYSSDNNDSADTTEGGGIGNNEESINNLEKATTDYHDGGEEWDDEESSGKRKNVTLSGLAKTLLDFSYCPQGCRALSKKELSLGIGIANGMCRSPVYCFIPLEPYTSWVYAIFYLVSFAIVSMLVMVGVAQVYAAFTRWLSGDRADYAFRINFASAIPSFLLGVVLVITALL